MKRTVLAKQIINRLNIDKYTNHEWNALFYTRRFFILNWFELSVVCLQVERYAFGISYVEFIEVVALKFEDQYLPYQEVVYVNFEISLSI